MKYIEAADYFGIYGPEDISSAALGRLGYEAERFLDAQTSGVDNVKKLREAFPIDEDGAEAVRRCVCALIHTMYEIEQARAAAGYLTREDGTVVNKTVSSVSSGSESISYATSGGASSPVLEAAQDEEKRRALLSGVVRDYLSGVTDANGVNLLYLGRYPHVP